jgi:hypothetical protein
MLPKSAEQSSIWQQQERFIIDIVHYEYLQEFLDIVEKEHIEMVQLVLDSFDHESN